MEMEVERGLLVELAEKFTHSDGSSRISDMEVALATMFTALPKDEKGTLTHDVVRYALHRLFVHRHSWYVRGLDSDSERAARNSSQALESVTEFDLNSIPVLPTLLQNSIEQFHQSMGLNLKELAAIAASIEDLAHREAIFHLGQAYAALHISQNAVLSEPEVDKILSIYFTMYVLGHDFQDWSNETILRRSSRYRAGERWNSVGGWLKKLQRNVSLKLFAEESGARNYSDLVRITEAIGDNFGKFNDDECKDMKHELLSIKKRKPGRVRLSDFYNRSKVGVWYFAEKIDYLRTLGALDESNLSDPLVIVSNYVTSPPQCLRASSVYDVCCPNECEALMLQLEGAIGAPTANPKALARLVADLSSDTVKPREELSPNLLRRLHEIAGTFGGFQVPLHSRKFALWMHHAFPNECPFPHVEGATAPLTPDEWMRSTGQATHVASNIEMDEHIHPDETCLITAPCGEADELPWPEELDLTSMSTLGAGHNVADGEPQQLTLLWPCAAIIVVIILHQLRAVIAKQHKVLLI